MVDLDILKAKGVSIEKLKETFALEKQKEAREWTATLKNGDESKKAKVGRLIRRIQNRAQGGRDFNLANARIYQALDAAWDLPHKQITPTMLMSLIDKKQEPDAVLSTLKTWGLDPEDVLVQVPDPKSGEMVTKVSIPAFFRVFVPLAKAYVTIRWAKLVNDRNQVPYFKYEPAISNKVTRMRCEVITATVEEMTGQYGYAEVEKQAIQKMLHLGVQFLFPCEAWSYEEQLVAKDSGYKGTFVNAEGEKVEKEEDAKYIKAVVKEGVNFHLPHIARTYRDMAHTAASFNTDSGATYAGYWRIMRYREVLNNKAFWNTDVIKIGDSSWYSAGQGMFQNIYPCSLAFPSARCAESTGDNDSERKVADGFYSPDFEDKGILINEYFEKLIPSENGLGDYDFPVWFRFVLAGDATIIYCEPVAYCPIVYYGYDADESKAIQSSMTLEVLPFQDQLGNLASQYFTSVHQNLTTLNLIDTDVIEEKDIGILQSVGSLVSRGLNFIRFSHKKFDASQTNPRALYSERLPQVDINSIAVAMTTVFSMVERLLVMSPQEMGQTATHEQTKEEVRVISSHTSARAEFTGAAADRARSAIKRLLYEGKMAYGEDEFYAQIPADPEITQETLSDLGFTWEGMDDDTRKITIKATKAALNKTAVPYQKFVANRDGPDRSNESAQAVQMASFLQQLMSNQMLAAAIGADQAIDIINQILRYGGFAPRDFKLHNQLNNQTLLDQNNQQVMQQVQQMFESLQNDLKGALQNIMEKNQEQDGVLQQLMQLIQPAAQPPQVTPMPPPAAMPVSA